MSTVVGVSRFGRMMERIFAESDAPYTPSEKLVLIAIGRHFGDKDSCWPTLARIAAQTGLSHRTVERLLKYHCEKSPRPLLARRRRESDETRGKWTNYVYTL